KQPRRPDPEPAIPPEVEAEIVREIQNRHYRDWLDEPVPALRDHTPREAATSKTLRPLLRNLLCEFENATARARLRGQRAYDTSWLWDELGLTPPRRARRMPARPVRP
ncbi:MAG TPA: hypothetical protein VFK20_04505, partial [Vicinamibacterales bacterium]|nr:hypothetical protein [Vicinamibacterales bacterium]